MLQPGYDVSVSREQPGWRTTSCKIIFDMKKENFELFESNFLRRGQDLSGLLILENLAPLISGRHGIEITVDHV